MSYTALKLTLTLRVSKNGRLTDTRLRKIFYNLRKILAFKRKTVKKLPCLPILTHFLCVLWPLRHISMQHFFLA